MADSLMTVEDVAEYLKVEESTIYTWANQGKIPALKISHFWRFKREDIDKWLEEGCLCKGKRMVKKTRRKIENILAQHREELKEKYKVEEIGIFGSYVRGDQNEKSDLDILVDFKEATIGLEFIELAEFLETILGMKVDLVSKGAIKPNRWKYIEKDLIYV